MNNLRIAGRALSSGLRQVHTTSNVQVQRSAILLTAKEPKESPYDNSCIPKTRAIQARFQKDDGLPVHLKGGPVDKVLYYFTFGLIAYGTFEGGLFMWDCYTS